MTRFGPESVVPMIVGGVVLGLVGGAAPSAAQAPGQGRDGPVAVVVTVLDEESGAPVDGALVRIPRFGTAALTGQRGVVEVEGLPRDTVTLVVSRIGYATNGVLVTIRRPTAIEVRLRPSAIELEGISVEIEGVRDRLERRRLSYAETASRSFDGAQLASSFTPSLSRYVAARAGAPLVGCARAGSGPRTCMEVRGRPIPTCVVLDEAPMAGGVEALDLVPPDLIEHVEVYPVSGAIRVYTRAFLARAARQPRLAGQTFTDPCDAG